MLNFKHNLGRLKDFLKEKIQVLKDVRSPMFKGQREVRSYLKKWFDSEGQGNWRRLASSRPPLMPSTVEMRRKRWGYYGRVPGGGSRTLRWSGGLRRSIFQKGAPNHIERWTAKGTLVFGSDYTAEGRPVVIFHDKSKGARRPNGGRNPRRIIYPMVTLRKIFTRTFWVSIQKNLGHSTIRPKGKGA